MRSGVGEVCSASGRRGRGGEDVSARSAAHVRWCARRGGGVRRGCAEGAKRPGARGSLSRGPAAWVAPRRGAPPCSQNKKSSRAEQRLLGAGSRSDSRTCVVSPAQRPDRIGCFGPSQGSSASGSRRCRPGERRPFLIHSNSFPAAVSAKSGPTKTSIKIQRLLRRGSTCIHSVTIDSAPRNHAPRTIAVTTSG